MKILTRILREQHLRVGLYLEEDDHTIRLMRGQETLAKFSTTGAKLEDILREADKYTGEVNS